jgi:hypothetical protein
MAEPTPPIDPTTPAAGNGRPMLSALSRWWFPATSAPVVDPVLGYESAHPWTLADEAADRSDTVY